MSSTYGPHETFPAACPQTKVIAEAIRDLRTVEVDQAIGNPAQTKVAAIPTSAALKTPFR
ncbi:MAG TPA: hypothetical protein VHM65_11470 [Candidatus Lustribacter sp.]|nr:hypothetical protein [Candidatus Lustribacter sp.]